jgi:hypothetical protein
VKLCLDEHYSPDIALALREAGFDVTSVKERPELISLSDEQLLSLVADEQRALLTENVQDFAPLVTRRAAEGTSHYGLIYTSSRSMPRSKATIGTDVAAVTRVLQAHPGLEDFVDRVEWLTP